MPQALLQRCLRQFRPAEDTRAAVGKLTLGRILPDLLNSNQTQDPLSSFFYEERTAGQHRQITPRSREAALTLSKPPCARLRKVRPSPPPQGSSRCKEATSPALARARGDACSGETEQQEERLCKSRQSREPARSVLFQQHLCVFWHLSSNRTFPGAAAGVRHLRRGRQSSKTRQLHGSPCSGVPDTSHPFIDRLTWLSMPERTRHGHRICGRVYQGPPSRQKPQVGLAGK